MRELKFRAWDKKTKNMVPVDEIRFSLGGQIKGIKWVVNEVESRIVLAEEMIIMLGTGLKDRVGKEIYEGDIVEGKHGVKAIIEWTQEFGRWSMRWSDGSTTPISWHVKHAIVIGNIHEGGLSDAELRENF